MGIGVDVAVGAGVLVATLAILVAVGAWVIGEEVGPAFFWLKTATAKAVVEMNKIATKADNTSMAVFLGFGGTGGGDSEGGVAAERGVEDT